MIFYISNWIDCIFTCKYIIVKKFEWLVPLFRRLAKLNAFGGFQALAEQARR